MLYTCSNNSIVWEVLQTSQITDKYQKKTTEKKRNKLNFNKLPYQQVSVEEKIQKLNPRDYEENGYHQVNQIKELK